MSIIRYKVLVINEFKDPLYKFTTHVVPNIDEVIIVPSKKGDKDYRIFKVTEKIVVYTTLNKVKFVLTCQPVKDISQDLWNND